MKKLPLAVAFGVLILALAVVMPTLIDTTQQDKETTRTFAENETITVNEHLQLHVDQIKPSQSTVNVTVTDIGTAESVEKTLSTGDSTEYNHPSGNVTVTVDSLSQSPDTATVTAVYSPYFGWGDGATLLFENMPIVLTLVAFIIVGIMLKGVIDL